MEFRDFLPSFLRPQKSQSHIVSDEGKDLTVKEVSGKLPVSGGRSSVPADNGLLGTILSGVDTLNPKYPMEFVTVLQNLATYNEDVGYAVDNIVQLASTKHNIYFDETLPDATKVEMMEELSKLKRRFYRGGAHSLVNDLLAQVAISGALSAESVVTESLDGVRRVVLVKPQSVVFKWDSKLGDYAPYQKSPVDYSGNTTSGGEIRLNPLTYKYGSYRRWDDSPYAIPPFLTVLEAIKIDHEMMCGFKSLLKRLGMFGFLKVMVGKPMQNQGESDDAYYRRLSTYLSTFIEPEMRKGLDSGLVIGFQGGAEFDLSDTVTNVTGVSGLFELMTTRRHAGLKQDPVMMGRNFSTTETLGRVILAKLSNQVKNYQEVVATFLEECYLLHLTLKGYPIEFVDVEFDAPMIGDELRDQQAYGQKIDNAIKLYNQGIIDQVGKAQMVGFDKPVEDEPLMTAMVDEGQATGESDKTQPSKGTQPNSVNEWVQQLNGDVEDVFSGHEVQCGCGSCSTASTDSYARIEDDMDSFVAAYFGDMKGLYSRAVNKVVRKVGEQLATLGQGATAQQVTDTILMTLYSNWGSVFINRQKAVIGKWVQTIYTVFRKDKKLLSAMKNAPEPFLDVADFRAIDFYKALDDFYMGKFIASPATRKAVFDFVAQETLVNGVPINGNRQTLAAFRTKFAGVLNLQDYQIKRIVDTTTNSLRNMASVNYMNQAEVQEYKILEVGDRLTCKWCSAMNGTVFSVSSSVSNLNELMQSPVDMLPNIKPFATAVFKDPADISKLNSRELQNKGVYSPPFHPLCRGVIAAVL